MKALRVFRVLLFVGLFGAGVNHLLRHFIDYPVYERAANHILSGEIGSLYDLQRTGPGGFYYSYFFGLAFIPFALLGPGILGKVLFLILVFLSYGKLLRFSAECASLLLGSPLSEKNKLIASVLLVLLTTYSFNDALMNANIGIFLLVLCLYAYDFRGKAPVLSGFCLALAVVFKIYPVIVACFFVWAKRWRVVCWTVFFSAVLYVFLPLLVYGEDVGRKILHDQIHVVSHFGQHWGYGAHVFQNFHATAIRLGSVVGIPEHTAFSFSLLFSCFATVLLFLKSFLSRRKISPVFECKMVVLILALVPLLVPVSWYNMGLFYAPLIAVILAFSLQTRAKEWGIALVLYSLLYCLTTPDLLGRTLNQTLSFYGAPFWGVVALIVVYVWRVRVPVFMQEGRESTPF